MFTRPLAKSKKISFDPKEEKIQNLNSQIERITKDMESIINFMKTASFERVGEKKRLGRIEEKLKMIEAQNKAMIMYLLRTTDFSKSTQYKELTDVVSAGQRELRVTKLP